MYICYSLFSYWDLYLEFHFINSIDDSLIEIVHSINQFSLSSQSSVKFLFISLFDAASNLWRCKEAFHDAYLTQKNVTSKTSFSAAFFWSVFLLFLIVYHSEKNLFHAFNLFFWISVLLIKIVTLGSKRFKMICKHYAFLWLQNVLFCTLRFVFRLIMTWFLL